MLLRLFIDLTNIIPPSFAFEVGSVRRPPMIINALDSLISEEHRAFPITWIHPHDLIHIFDEFYLLGIGDFELLIVVGVQDQFDEYVLIALVDFFWDLGAVVVRLDLASKEILYVLLN